MRMSLVSCLLVGCVVGGGSYDERFEGVTAVDATISNGALEVRTADDDDVRVRYDGGGLGDAGRPDLWVDDGLLTIDAGGLGGSDLRLELPPGADLDAQVSTGDLVIELDAPSSISACVAAGSLSLGLPAGAYDFDIGMAVGAIEEAGLDHDPESPWKIDVCVAVGAIDLHVTDRD